MKTEDIKNKARELARERGLIQLTAAELSDACGIPRGSFTYRAGQTFSELVKELAKEDLPTQPIGTPFNEGVGSRSPSKELRKRQILDAAVQMAEGDHYRKITRQRLAQALGISESLINNYFGSIENLRTEIVKQAVDFRILHIIAQAHFEGHPALKHCPMAVKKEALEQSL